MKRLMEVAGETLKCGDVLLGGRLGQLELTILDIREYVGPGGSVSPLGRRVATVSGGAEVFIDCSQEYTVAIPQPG